MPAKDGPGGSAAENAMTGTARVWALLFRLSWSFVVAAGVAEPLRVAAVRCFVADLAYRGRAVWPAVVRRWFLWTHEPFCPGADHSY